MHTPRDHLSPALRARLVRYAELRPCTNAFIDARTPGSDQKENFTIIGPGVAENPDQYVHIRDPHGFNIGGARQPPHCTNSLHSHDSEEVFIVQSGTWRFFWGEHGEAGEVTLKPGDTISIPIHVFRGFENIGTDVGFLFAVLGGDDPGRVHWAPHVIEKARGYGLVLLESGRLIDTTRGELVPENAAVVKPSTPDEIAYIGVPSNAEMTARVVPHGSLRANPNSALAQATKNGLQESAIIGAGMTQDGFVSSPINLPHGFSLRHLSLPSGTTTPFYRRDSVEVLFVHRGLANWTNGMGQSVELTEGDTFSVPIGQTRALDTEHGAELYVVLGGDDPGPLLLS